jgi:hypothetical protein
MITVTRMATAANNAPTPCHQYWPNQSVTRFVKPEVFLGAGLAGVAGMKHSSEDDSGTFSVALDVCPR